MGAVVLSHVLRSQPQYATTVIRTGLGRRLERAVNMAVPTPCDLAGGAPITYLSGGTVAGPKSASILGSGPHQESSLYNSVLEVAAWTDETSEGTFCLVAKRAAATDNTGWNVGNAGIADHFPFSNQAYFDCFWSSRWGSAVNAPTGAAFSDPVVLVFSVKDGSQRAFWNGRLWHSNTLTGGFTLPTTLVLAHRDFKGVIHAAFAWSRALSDTEAISVGNNPWQLFSPLKRRIWVDVAAAAGGEFQAAWVRNNTVLGAGVN